MRREAGSSIHTLGWRFLEEYVPIHCKPSTQEEYRRLVTLFVDSAICDQRISEIEHKAIATLHHEIRETHYQASQTLRVLSKMFCVQTSPDPVCPTFLNTAESPVPTTPDGTAEH